MAKNPDVEALRKVDVLDVRALKLKRELVDLPTDLKRHQDKVAAQKARVQTSHDEQKRLQKEIDKLALDVKSNEDQVKKYQLQQSTAKSNEEYNTFKRQIEALKKANGELDDKQLVFYEKVDALKAQEKLVRSELAEAEKNLITQKAQIDTETKAVEQELGEVLAQKAVAEKVVTPGILTLYKRILDKTQNRALAALQGRTCLGCRVELPTGDVGTLLAGKDVVLCKQCARILYVEDHESTVSASSYFADGKRNETSKDGNW